MRFFGGGSCKQNMLSPSNKLIFEGGDGERGREREREEREERGRKKQSKENERGRV